MFDISPVVPEARDIVQRAAPVYWDHTQEWFLGLLIHGSALKGGFISGCSDIDMQLFLRDEAFAADGQLPLELSLAIHRDIARIDPAPFQYIQCYAVPGHLTPGEKKGDIGPVPGTYHMLAGDLPVPEATAEQILSKSRRYLAELEIDPSRLAGRLLQHGGGILERGVRFLCTEIWPTLYCLLACRAADPLAVWRLPKEEAIALLPEDTPPGREIRLFHELAKAYYLGDQSVERALPLIASGHNFKRAVKTNCKDCVDNY